MHDEYKISGMRTTLCQAGKKVEEMVAAGNGSFLVVLSSEKGAGGYPMYIDSVSQGWENVFGVMKTITDKNGNNLDDTDIKIICEQEYRITDIQFDGRNITGKLTINEAVSRTAPKEKLFDELYAIAKSKVDEGIISEELAIEKIQYMAENLVDPYLCKRVVSYWKEYGKPAHRPSCLYVDPFLESSKKKREEGVISMGLRQAVSGYGVILEGDKSVGKNVFAETITWLLGMPMYLITFNRQMSPASIYGEKSTDNSAASALAGFDPDILKKAEDFKAKRDFMIQHFAMMKIPGNGDEQIKAINTMMSQILTPEENAVLKQAEEFRMLQARAASVNIIIDQSELYDWLTMGGVMVFNEMNMADANFFASFANQLLDGTGFLFIPGRGEVRINPDCVLFGTQNADYEGVEQANEATMSRFNAMVFPQPDTIKGQLVAAVKAALKKDGFEDTAVNPDFFSQTEKFYKQCSSSVKKAIVSNACLNIRGFVRAITMAAESNGVTKLKRAIEISVINTCPMDERQDLYATLDAIVSI